MTQPLHKLHINFRTVRLEPLLARRSINNFTRIANTSGTTNTATPIVHSNQRRSLNPTLSVRQKSPSIRCWSKCIRRPKDYPNQPVFSSPQPRGTSEIRRQGLCDREIRTKRSPLTCDLLYFDQELQFIPPFPHCSYVTVVVTARVLHLFPQLI